MNKNNKKSRFSAFLIGLIPLQLLAAPVMAATETNFNSWRWKLILVAVFLAFFIYKLSAMTRNSHVAKVRRAMKKAATDSKTMIGLLLISFQFLMTRSFAQEAAPEAAATATEEPSFISTIPGDIWFAFIIIIMELAIIFYLLPLEARIFNENEAEARKMAEAEGKTYVPKKAWWKRFINAFGVENTEEDIKKLDLHHDYDGISELDNRIPAWWNWAFAGTIVFAVVYLIRFFITGGIPSQEIELAQANKAEEIRMEAYLLKAGGLIDENNVTVQDAAGIAAGKVLFDKNCVACHGAAGEGGIGPNLTDIYWLHGGNLKDVFYSIKYGWPEKGMKSWKDDFSPEQMADLASYVKSIKGTNPPNAKEPQGEEFKETE